MKPELLKEIAMIKRNISLLEDYVYPKDVSYSNIVFRDKYIPDKVNRALLDDINLAASKGNVVVTIGAIKSKHPKGKNNDPSTRHTSGNAVDIPIINGKAVKKEIKSEVERFTNQLENLGYTKNKEEEGNQIKAFLTFGFPGHDDHVHVSNKSEEPTPGSSSDSSSESSSGTTVNVDRSVFKQSPARFNLSNLTKAIQDFKDKLSL
jgi:hypothetical protein